ncbi:hypothetical protein J6E39_09065 [bacterium]|nr:hypothetical protein [bacterium]
MKNIAGIVSLAVIIMVSSIIPAFAVVHYRDVSYDKTSLVYTCKIRKQRCTVRKISYMQRNRAYYDASCTGSSFEQGAYTKAVETDVRRKRFEYCRLVSTY